MKFIIGNFLFFENNHVNKVFKVELIAIKENEKIIKNSYSNLIIMKFYSKLKKRSTLCG